MRDPYIVRPVIHLVRTIDGRPIPYVVPNWSYGYYDVTQIDPIFYYEVPM